MGLFFFVSTAEVEQPIKPIKLLNDKAYMLSIKNGLTSFQDHFGKNKQTFVSS